MGVIIKKLNEHYDALNGHQATFLSMDPSKPGCQIKTHVTLKEA